MRIVKAERGQDLPPLISGWPDEWREVLEERAAILEYEAFFSRADAESRAEYWTRRQHRRDKGDTRA